MLSLSRVSTSSDSDNFARSERGCSSSLDAVAMCDVLGIMVISCGEEEEAEEETAFLTASLAFFSSLIAFSCFSIICSGVQQGRRMSACCAALFSAFKE